MAFTDPLHLTVVRMSGPLLSLYEKPERLILSISVVDNDYDPGLPHEVVLDCYGRNANSESVIPVHEVKATTKLIIEVFRLLEVNKKKHMGRFLIAFAFLSLQEFLNEHPPLPRLGSVDYDVLLARYPPQCKSPTSENNTQYSAATLTMRFELQKSEPGPSQLESAPSLPVSVSEHYETEPLLSGAPSCTSRVFNGYVDEDEDEDEGAEGAEGEEDEEDEEGEEETFSPSELPVHYAFPDQVGRVREGSFEERFLCWVSPYEEITEAAETRDREKAEKVLARLQTEWHVVSRSFSVLGTAGAVVVTVVAKFAPERLRALEGFPRDALIVAGMAVLFGMLFNTMFLLLYGLCVNPVKFLFITQDVYDTYILFSLTCRLPILCLAISMVSLMSFPLAVACTAWPTAMLVMSFVAGLLLTGELIVFGTSRLVNFAIWFKRAVWRALVRLSGYSPSCPGS